MRLDEYQQLAERTAKRGAENEAERRYAHFGMGIAGEAGEVCDLLKKVVFHGHSLNRDRLCKELGDVLWYVATLATTAGLSLEEVAVTNLAKIKTRYPEGFSSERSLDRGVASPADLE